MDKLNTDSVDFFGTIIAWFVSFVKVAIESWWFYLIIFASCIFILIGLGLLISALIRGSAR